MTLRRDYEEPEPVVGARWVQLGHARFALVSEEDFADVSQYKWSTPSLSDIPRATTERGWTALHHFICGHRLVDHRNGDQLDNRRENLRFATQTLNTRNAAKHLRNGKSSSQYKGVSWNTKRRKWYVFIRVEDGKKLYLGSFKDEIAAALTYDDAARKHHGEFACVNFANGDERCGVRAPADRWVFP